MIFIDSNIPIYLIGKEHPNKGRTIALLDEFARSEEKLVTSAEVFQELLHRYRAIQELKNIQIAFDALQGFVEEIFPVSKEDVFYAKDLALRYSNLSSRDALYVAQMKRLNIKTIFSFDTGFDQVSGIVRIPNS